MTKRKFTIIVREIRNIWADVEFDTESEDFKEALENSEGNENEAIEQMLMQSDWEVQDELGDDQELVYKEEIE